MNGSGDWMQRVAALRAWRRGGVRAPHKPLLLLYVLGRVQRERASPLVRFADAEPALRSLLEEFGPPHPTSPGYPFHHLTSDGLWLVRTDSGGGSPGSGLAALRSSGATGELAPAFGKALLADPELVVRVARLLLEANFPATLHEDIAAAVGLDLDEVPPSVVTDLMARRRRDPAFRERVLLAYEGRCAMCGWQGRLASEAVGVEAAHIRWFTIDGPDSLDNGLCLCSLHHKLFDAGAIGINPDRTLAVSLRFVGHGPVAEALVYGVIGRPLEPPQDGLDPPAAAHIAWHAEQVFRQPGRMTA